MNLKMEAVCAPSEDIVYREIEGEVILVPLVAGIGDAEDELYTLNATGRAVWERLDGVRTLAQVADSIAEEYSSPADAIAADVLGFVEEMLRRKMLTVRA